MSSFRSRRSLRYVARPKRNAERVIRGGNAIVDASSQQAVYTWTAPEACTVKSIKLDMGAASVGVGVGVLVYALVRVPEGYDVNALTYPALTEDLYNPTELVLLSGILTDNAVEDHKWNKIGRKMKKGDRIALICASVNTGQVVASFELSFSVLT